MLQDRSAYTRSPFTNALFAAGVPGTVPLHLPRGYSLALVHQALGSMHLGGAPHTPVQVGVFSTEKVSYQRVFVDQFAAAPGSLVEIAPDVPGAPAPVLAPGAELPLAAPTTGGQRSGAEGGPKEGGSAAAALPSGTGMVNPRGGIDMTTSSQVDQPVLGAAVTIQQEW